jgi:hypothetical protein
MLSRTFHRNGVAIALAAVFVATGGRDGRAQRGVASGPLAGTEIVDRVTVDLSAGAFDRVLPFDVPFFIGGVAPTGTASLEVQYAELAEPGSPAPPDWRPAVPAVWRSEPPTTSGQAFQIYIREPLKAHREYQFRFSFPRSAPTGEAPQSQAPPSPNARTIVVGRTARNTYMSADAGMLYAGDISAAALYLGTNVYFRPVNKKAPLSEVSSFSRRFALTFGITVSSVSDEDNRTRSGLVADQSLVIGGGYRVTRSLRAGGGAIVFNEHDSNPLISRKSTAATWYVSISFDLDVAKGLAALGSQEK